MASVNEVITSFAIPRGRLVANVASNNLTVAIKLADGVTDPSPTSPLFTTVRSNPASGAALQGRAIVAPLSLTYNAGGTIPPSANNLPFRIWVLLIDDGGIFRLALTTRYNPIGYGGSIFSLEFDDIVSTVTDGFVGDIVTPGVTVTSKPSRVVGCLDWSDGLPAAGSFSIGPDPIKLFGFGSRLPGDPVRARSVAQGTTGGTTVVPWDDTIPQRGEGDAYFIQQPTFSSKCNAVRHKMIIHAAHSAGANPIVASLHYMSGHGSADALVSAVATPPAANQPVQLALDFTQPVPELSAGFQINVGGTVAGTLTVSGVSLARKLGGVWISYYETTEYVG